MTSVCRQVFLFYFNKSMRKENFSENTQIEPVGLLDYKNPVDFL